MLRIAVTNSTAEHHTWHVEPYGDEVLLMPRDVLEVEVRDAADAVVQIELTASGSVVWTQSGGGFVAPTGLKRNGTSLWPA